MVPGDRDRRLHAGGELDHYRTLDRALRSDRTGADRPGRGPCSSHAAAPQPTMIPLSAGISYVDLNFQGRPRIIATAVLSAPGSVALVDPGPTSTLPALTAGLERAGIALDDVTALLLTHIHLD